MAKSIIKPDWTRRLRKGHWSTKGLVFYSPFKKATNLVDYSPYRNHGTIVGAEWVGEGLNFDSDYVDLGPTPLLPSIDDWTFQAVVNSSLNSDIDVFFSQYLAGVGNGRVNIEQTNDTGPWTFRIFLGSDPSLGSVVLNSTTQIVVGVEYNLMITRKFRTFSIYVNGILENSITEAATRQILQAGNLLGGRTSTSPYNGNLNTSAFWHGSISDVKVYNLALSESEIQALCIKPDLPMARDISWMAKADAAAAAGIVILRRRRECA